MPVTREMIGDALGLSVPHVNRTLRQLRQDELVRIEEHVVILQDVEALAALADFERSYLARSGCPGSSPKADPVEAAPPALSALTGLVWLGQCQVSFAIKMSNISAPSYARILSQL
jgi:Crp-like helix-turn-helix domain